MSVNLKVRPGKDRVLSIFIKNLIPSIFGLLALTTAWIIDGIFVGRYVGPHGIAAINLSYPLVSFSFGISVMIAMGGSTLAGAAKGSKELKKVNRIFSATVLLITLFSFAFTFFGLIFKKQLINLLGADEVLSSFVSEYLTVILYFILPLVLTYTFDAFIRNSGAPGFSLLTLTSGSVLNIILDYFFVCRLGYGLTGAAYATGIAQLVTSAAQIFFFYSKASAFRFTLPFIPVKSVFMIIYNGSSEFINEMSAGVTAYLFNLTLMKRIGSEGVSAFSIFNYVMMIALMVFFAAAQSIQPEINYCFGAGKKDRIRKMLILGAGFNLVAGIVFFTAVYLKADTLAHLFTGQTSSLDNIVTEIARYFSFAFLISGINITASAYFTSIQEAGKSALIASSRGLIFVVIFLMILPQIIGNAGIWLTVPAAEILTMVITVYLIIKKKSFS